ncbi:MAG: MBOAT family protein [Pseudobutyrivibrio sp.]|nr:MBOAT family protein [Pseudobutyrivibrio sp.]
MLFNSYSFLAFFPIVCILYFALPHRFRKVMLLVASYYFYMGWNAKYALILWFSTTITYLAGLGVDHFKDNPKKKKLILILSLVSNLGILAFFKYFGFIIHNINRVLGAFGASDITNPFAYLLLPVGISFYIFQALGYSIDVYRGDLPVEKDYLKYALFVSFFPQLVAGPIERSKNLLNQFDEVHTFDYRRMCDGLLEMTWGFFIKLVVADRLAIFVDFVYNSPEVEGRFYLLASVLFAFQIYCDFAGYSTIAIGCARIMGFTLMENFNAPYLSQSVAEFWRRWHISLSTWFRDYLYIPLGGNRKGKARKWLNLMIVFGVSGLWHGADYTYVIWGLLNGGFQVIGEWISPFKKKIEAFCVNGPSKAILRVVRTVITFALIDFAWIFFRAGSLDQANQVLFSILHMEGGFHFGDTATFMLGFSKYDFILVGISLVVMLFTDICRYNGVVIRERILNTAFPLRWFICIFAVLFIMLFGIWGSGYNQTQFIYFQF